MQEPNNTPHTFVCEQTSPHILMVTLVHQEGSGAGYSEKDRRMFQQTQNTKRAKTQSILHILTVKSYLHMLQVQITVHHFKL